MVLKAVNWVQSDKIRSNGLESSQLGTQYKIMSYGLERSDMVWNEWFGYTIQTSGQMVLKGINCVHNNKIKSNGLERSQLGTQW